jgi:hypothetical protein
VKLERDEKKIDDQDYVAYAPTQSLQAFLRLCGRLTMTPKFQQP